MYSDNDKDFLENLDDSQDNAVSWDNILSTDEDGIVSIKYDSGTSPSSDAPIQTEVFSNDNDDSDLESLKDILNESAAEEDAQSNDEIDEDELKRILNDNPDDNLNIHSSEYNQSLNRDISQDIDIDDKEPEIAMPRRDEIKSQGVSPILIAVLFAVLVSGGVYLFFNFKSGEDDSAQQSQIKQEDTLQEATVNNQEENAIPVVNEEEVDSVKPDESQEADKKEVVNVVPTGRVNPFLPLNKYINASTSTVRTINNIDYDSITIPKPPTKYGEISEYTDKLMTITVSGIMYDKVKPSAIITYENEDYFVQIGDKLNMFKVVGISPNYVMVSLGKNVYRANLGEELKISEFYGNVRNGSSARQYFSSEDEYTNSIEGKSPYTSNSDVKIYTR